jgi:hypothetical protein
MSTVGLVEDEKYVFAHIYVLENYGDIEKIASILENEFEMTIGKKLDGPDTRIWHLNTEGGEILLINDDPFGNFLRAESESGKSFLKRLLPKLEARFGEI